MKKRPEFPALFSARPPSPQFDELLTRGIPATIDSDAGEQIALSHLMNDYELSVRYGNRAALLRTWLDLQLVTLEQATWLLLGRDPFDPNGANPEPASVHLIAQYKDLENRLECEITLSRLRPHGKYIPGFPRRLKFVGVVAAAKRIKMGLSVVEQVEQLIKEGKIANLPEPPHQVERTNRRYAVHRELVEIIIQKRPSIVSTIPPNTSPSKRRKTPVQAINVRLAMKQGQYIAMFHERYAQKFNGEPDQPISDSMLYDDREALNIRFYRGRTLGSKSRPINER